MKHLYIIQSAQTGAIKIGRTSDIDQRIKTLQTSNPYPLKVILFVESYGYLERELHERLKQYKTNGEWFKYEGLSELPVWLYEQLNLDSVDQWWRYNVEPTFIHYKSSKEPV